MNEIAGDYVNVVKSNWFGYQENATLGVIELGTLLVLKVSELGVWNILSM